MIRGRGPVPDNPLAGLGEFGHDLHGLEVQHPECFGRLPAIARRHLVVARDRRQHREVESVDEGGVGEKRSVGRQHLRRRRLCPAWCGIERSSTTSSEGNHGHLDGVARQEIDEH